MKSKHDRKPVKPIKKAVRPVKKSMKPVKKPENAVDSPKKPGSKTLTDFFREQPAHKKPEHKKPPTETFHEVSTPTSEFQQLGSNYQPPQQNGQ
jgi:hypothetical protein